MSKTQIEKFAAEKLALDPTSTHTKGKSLWVAYLTWCFENDEGPVGKKRFFLDLESVVKVRRDSGNRWYGLVVESDVRAQA